MNEENDSVKILLVDDDYGHAELVKINLYRRDINCNILHFNSGQKVLDYLFDKNTNLSGVFLILLDLNMPGLDGHQVLYEVKYHKKTRKIPVFIFSTAVNSNEINQCYENGCNLYIPKPMDYKDFSNAIDKLRVFIQVTEFPFIQN